MDGRAMLARAFDQWFTQSGMNQGQVATAGGPSTTTQTKVRQSDGPISRQTLRQIDHVTGWGAGTAARILAGESIGLRESAPTPGALSTPELLAELARRLGLHVVIDDGPADAELPTPRR